MDRVPVIEALRDAARLIGTGPDVDALRAIQAAQDALDGAKVAHLAALAECRGFEAEGASSLGAWARLQLRLSAREVSALTRSAATLTRLPAVAEAAMAGQIRAAHVNVFGYGLKHVGTEHVTQMMGPLLEVARTCEPGELFRVMRALREALYPDDLDQAWADGMDKADLQVNAVPQGFSIAATPSLRWLLCERFPADPHRCQVPRRDRLAVSASRCGRPAHRP